MSENIYYRDETLEALIPEIWPKISHEEAVVMAAKLNALPPLANWLDEVIAYLGESEGVTPVVSDVPNE